MNFLKRPGFLIGLVVASTLGLVFFDQTRLPVTAQNCDEIQCSKDSQSEDVYLSCIKEKQGCWTNKINEAQNQAVTLGNTISILNGQISLQVLQIDQTQAEISTLEREIGELSERIAGLEVSLDRLSTLLVQRIQEQYRRSRTSPTSLTLISNSVSKFVTQLKYLEKAQAHVSEAMQRAETQRLTYDEQKQLKEKKQAEVQQKKAQLEAQQVSLTKQRSEQQYLLTETRNNEARYQSELAKTQAELEAIQSIIAGRGDESRVGEISQGDHIADIIVGASSCSTGTHLHFEVAKDGTHRDPAGYLKSVDIAWNNSPDGSFSFSGGWEWPVNNPAQINQGYGNTYYARVKRAYGGAPHTGIDIVSKSSGNYQVKAVKPGVLYRGSIPCGGGLLRYVKVEHKDDGISTYYLHINY